ncbi:MAG TPA: FAD-dependent oxidoreductase, partial [Chitinophagaceae bacterium]|nr:FAD-dependent oxidoreductase [Chitinophagaceae bacterium]
MSLTHQDETIQSNLVFFIYPQYRILKNNNNSFLMKQYDFLILGAGIFGITTAIELRKKKYSVGILNPDTIPHPLAESTDISKIIRMEYGTDEEYMDMAAECIIKWREWNEFFRD